MPNPRGIGRTRTHGQDASKPRRCDLNFRVVNIVVNQNFGRSCLFLRTGFSDNRLFFWLWCKRERAGDDEEIQRIVPIEDVFKGRHFDRQIIVLCVSWYRSFKLSLRHLVSMMADRGISVTHRTILRGAALPS